MTRTVRAADDRGFSLVEMLVAMTIFGGLTTALFTVVLAVSNAGDTSRVANDLNGEARVVLNRLTRELREAQRITAAVNPGGPGHVPTADSSLTLEVDFNGNGTIEPAAADPEVLTYRYERAQRRLVLEAGGVSAPVLGDDVEAFTLTYRARTTNARLQYDGLSASTGGGSCGSKTQPLDAVLDWRELDADPAQAVGNCNAVLDVELDQVDLVLVDLTVLKTPREQRYRTQVDLRNAS